METVNQPAENNLRAQFNAPANREEINSRALAAGPCPGSRDRSDCPPGLFGGSKHGCILLRSWKAVYPVYSIFIYQ